MYPIANPPISLTTKRLTLRPWSFDDFDSLAKLTQNPVVMEYFPSVLTREESDTMGRLLKAKIEENGWGFWAALITETQEFIGFIGLNGLTRTSFPAPFTPAVEVGWRLAPEYWGYGFATEGALASLQYGFDALKLNEIVAYTAEGNARSRAVMHRIGMTYEAKDDFIHPELPLDHRLTKQVVYRIDRENWNSP